MIARGYDSLRPRATPPAGDEASGDGPWALCKDGAVGFNPLRPARRRTSDYMMLAAAFTLVAALLAWALSAR